MTYEQLKRAALDAIRKLHADTSVSLTTTLESMVEVAELADELVQVMEEELDL